MPHHSFRWIALKSGNPLHSAAASCPSLLFNPAAFFSTTGFGSAFCLVKGALCNTGQHQLVVPGLQVSPAFRDSRHKTVSLLINIHLAAGRSICCHSKPFTPQPLTAARLRRSGEKTVVQHKCSCRAILSAFAAFFLIFSVSHKAPSITITRLKNRQMPCLML